jgi:FkbM family methyltransferase
MSFLRTCVTLWDRTATNMRDVAAFGPQFLLRHLPRITGSDMASVGIPGVGPIHLRSGESDVATVRQIFLHGEYELRETIHARVAARYTDIMGSGRTPVIVDAGANIGAASLSFRKKFPGAAIVAVEPDAENLRMLKLNLKGHQDVFVVAAAVGCRDGFVKIEEHGQAWASRTKRDSGGVPIITMARAFARVKNGIPFIAKIDIEGFESDLFTENTDWLNEVYLVAIEPHDWLLPGERTSRAFQAAMGQRDFEIFVSGENLIYVRV